MIRFVHFVVTIIYRHKDVFIPANTPMYSSEESTKTHEMLHEEHHLLHLMTVLLLQWTQDKKHVRTEAATRVIVIRREVSKRQSTSLWWRAVRLIKEIVKLWPCTAEFCNEMDVDEHLKIFGMFLIFGFYSSSQIRRKIRIDRHAMVNWPSKSKLLQKQ